MSNDIDLASERNLLAILANNPALIFDVNDIQISDSDFSNVITQSIYISIKDIAENQESNKPISEILIEEKIGNMFPKIYESNLKLIKEALSSIMTTQPIDSINEYTRIISTKSLKKKLKIKLQSMIKKIDEIDNAESIIGEIESDIINYTTSLSKSDKTIKLGENFQSFMKNKIEELKIKGKIDLGISSGYPLYDDAIGGGLRYGSIHTIIARVKQGKSLLSMNIAANVAKENIPVLYLDTELDSEYQLSRLISIVTNVPLMSVEKALFVNNQEEYKTLRDHYTIINGLPLYYVSIKGLSLSDQISLIRQWFIKHVGKKEDGQFNKALVVYDYLKLMDVSDKGFKTQEYEQIGYRMTTLHNLMHKYKTPMLLIAQQNREGMECVDERTVSGSDRISWLTDSLSILKCKNPDEISLIQAGLENSDNKNVKFSNTKLYVILSRHGPTTGENYVGIYADINDYRCPTEKVCGKFEQISIESEIYNNGKPKSK